jgi:hypothetical protein
MKTAPTLLAIILSLGPVAGGASATASEPAETKPTAAAEAEAKKEKEKELKLPPGFKKVQRGKFTLYCKKETPLGSRFKTDRCLDEAGMRDYILALEATKGDVDRMRSTCSNACTCGMDC